MSSNLSVYATHEGHILEVRGRPQVLEAAGNVCVKIIPAQCKVLLGAHTGYLAIICNSETNIVILICCNPLYGLVS